MSEPVKRSLVCTITLQVTADLYSQEGETTVQLMDARHAILGTMQSPEGAKDSVASSEEFRQLMGVAVSKLGLKYLLDKLNGEHQGAVPTSNQFAVPGGASA